jgi:hypothetical protein
MYGRASGPKSLIVKGEFSGEPHFASWNRLHEWLGQFSHLRRVA